ncbi:hypothetical protein RWV98_16085 [Agathobaculum sp. NTUH-O15-33]|uniref:hypothetical protein n=1 Tax=Agathobaculum sp. NTUH-O15-33 TaxID=3079302 RepID=UPI002958C872|nr:hypothetical protein [Agathobaculum sp. NTUH-O15-33]WNX84079.1 hypothetical protein RWV98_16085 [Agathobaculum sp. NTUH-O15-33]
MNCYHHEDRVAVGTCQVCGKALCKECAGKHTPCLCDECFDACQTTLAAAKAQAKKDAIIDTHAEFVGALLKGLLGAVGLTALFGLLGGGNIMQIAPMGIGFFFVPFGWAVLTYIEQWLPAFLMDGIVFLFYLVVKLMLSMFLGIPCFLYQIIKYIYKLVKRAKD